MTAIALESNRQHSPTALPTRWPWLFRGFRKYARKYAAKHLHSVRIAKCARPPSSWNGAAIMVMNHPSWWDPIIAFILSDLWPNRQNFAPIDAKALRQYRFLSKVGMFGVEQGTARGAREFLRTGHTILTNDQVTLWVTAQGEFTDVRSRPVQLRGGVGHLSECMDNGVIIPIALEYSFWNERTPEALVAFGQPMTIADCACESAETWTAQIARSLETIQDVLAIESQSRDDRRFDVLVQGRAGVGGIYDWGRRMRAWMSGRRFHAEHSPSFADE